MHDDAANQTWLEIVPLAADLTSWTQMLSLTGHPAPQMGTQTPAAAGLLRRRTPARGGRHLRSG